MKQIHRAIRYLLAIGVAIGFTIPPNIVVAASPNKLYATSYASSVMVGDQFVVTIKSYSSSAGGSGSVNGTITYPSNLIQIQSPGISTVNSSYNNPSISQSTGAVSFSATRTPSPGGTATVFEVTFQAKAAGDASVNFTTNSTVDNSTTTYNPLNLSISSPQPAPTPAPAPAPASTPSNSNQKQSTPIATPVPEQSSPPLANETPITTVEDTTGTVTNVIVTPSYTSSVVSWTVNAPNPTATLSYGQSASQMDKQAVPERQSDGTFTATLTGLQPGAVYYFAIIGSGTGKPDGTYSSTVHTSGYPVTMTVTENNIAANHAEIKIGSSSFSTNSDGKTTFGLAAGSYSGEIITDTSTMSINFTVAAKTIPADGSTPDVQSFSYNLTSSPLEQGPGTTTTLLTFAAVLVGGALLLVFGFLFYVNYRRRQFESGSITPTYQSSTVVIEDGFDWHQEPQPTYTPPPTINKNEQQIYSSSVHLTEEEPLDMFEKAKLEQASQSDIRTQSNDSLHIPNSPHSTTL